MCNAETGELSDRVNELERKARRHGEYIDEVRTICREMQNKIEGEIKVLQDRVQKLEDMKST